MFYGNKKTKVSKQEISAKVTYARGRLLLFCFFSCFTILHKLAGMCGVYSIQGYVIKFVIELLQVGNFSLCSPGPTQTKLTAKDIPEIMLKSVFLYTLNTNT